MQVALSLGSNLGNRAAHLTEARRRIAELPGIRILAASPLYETEPVGVAEAYRDRTFLNAALLVDSDMPILEFARLLHEIETDMGRTRGPDRNAPRAIDVDIIAAESEHFAGPELVVPHPRWSERRFVAQPLADLCPDWILPGESRTVRAILESLPERPAVLRSSETWGDAL